jgi:hypothetical protein
MTTSHTFFCLTLFEIKYYQDPIFLNKKNVMDLKTKIEIFRQATQTKKQILISMISANGVLQNEHSNGFLAHNIDGDDLFTD